MTAQTHLPPIPEGAKFLFDDQDKPFAGDTFMERDFLALKEKFGIKTVVETGTCYASTALWFAEHFDRVITVESHQPTADVAKERTTGIDNLELIVGDSAANMRAMMEEAEGPILCFLDAHFEKYCPLLDELAAIAESGKKPVIAIHDFQVPQRPDLGFDTWNGKPFVFSWVRPALERIYGTQFGHHYNNEAVGQKRGCLYVTPL